MEDTDEFDTEVIRLKRLVEDQIIKAERENLELIRNGFLDQSAMPSNLHTLQYKQKSFAGSTQVIPSATNEKMCSGKHDIKPHSNPSHCMKHSGNTSPHSKVHFLNRMEQLLVTNMKQRVLQNELKSRYYSCAIPLSPPVRIRKEENIPYLHEVKNDFVSSDGNMSYKQSRSKSSKNKEFVMQTLPGITISSTKSMKSASVEAKISSCEIDSKSFGMPSAPCPKQCFGNTSLNQNVEGTTNTNSGSNLIEAKEEGFNLNISLDSLSTKDMVNRFLQRISDLLYIAENSNRDTTCKLATSENQCSYANLQKSDHEQTSDVIRGTERLQKEIPSMESCVQTDPMIHEPVYKQPEFHELVKDIVMDTLKNLNTSESRKPAAHKVDSGIQSEIESCDVILNNNVQYTTFNDEKVHSVRPSVAVQANTESLKSVCDKNINTSYEDMPESDFHHLYVKEEETQSSGISPKVELMVQKIYEHICEKNLTSNDYIDVYERPIIRTREVAVQFNPLHTSNKSTTTTEIKTSDSSTQYDTTSRACPTKQSDAFVQVPCLPPNQTDNCCLQVDAYTQFDTPCFRNNAAQTDVMNTELYTSNASLSSTPVSDTMFMDDLISEGEIPLPWNLRLLSSAGGGGGGVCVNHADSSDNSVKEKDSLSEGEVHPSMLCHLNCSTDNDENGMHFCHYSPGCAFDPKVLYSTKRNAEKHSESMRFHHPHFSCSSSEGEVHSNTSLSLGQIPPSFKVPLAESSRISDTFPSCCNCVKIPRGQASTGKERAHQSDISIGEIRNEDTLNKLLQTVEEETYYVFK